RGRTPADQRGGHPAPRVASRRPSLHRALPWFPFPVPTGKKRSRRPPTLALRAGPSPELQGRDMGSLRSRQFGGRKNEARDRGYVTPVPEGEEQVVRHPNPRQPLREASRTA